VALNKQGEERLQELEKVIDNLKTTLKSDLSKVDEKVKAIKKEVLEIKKLDPPGHARLDDAFNKVLVPSLTKMLPDEALKQLTKFETEKLKAAKDKAAKSAQELKEFMEAATAFRKELDKTGLETTAPALYKRLMARRDMAKLTAPGNLASARNELSSMQLMMEVAKDNQDGARATLNEDAEQEGFQEDRRKEEYLAAKELFNLNYKAKALDAKDTRPDDYQGMVKLVKQADKMADRTPPDFAGARENLNQAIELAKVLIENAIDDTSPSGRNIVKLNASWKNRVGVYLKEVATLTSELEQATNSPADAKAIHKALDPLLGLFNPRAFDKDAAIFAKPKDEMKEMKKDMNGYRKTKEDFLVRIRRFESRLKTNKTLKHVVGNPVSEVHIKALKDTLQGLHAEVLGS